jgi:hypothetical protein
MPAAHPRFPVRAKLISPSSLVASPFRVDTLTPNAVVTAVFHVAPDLRDLRTVRGLGFGRPLQGTRAQGPVLLTVVLTISVADLLGLVTVVFIVSLEQ